jgi:hypothetical protein
MGGMPDTMLVAITCPTCRRRGYIAKNMLPRWLSCSHCRTRARFDLERLAYAVDFIGVADRSE